MTKFEKDAQKPGKCFYRLREIPVGYGALDETFDHVFSIAQHSVAGVPQAGVFFDCSKCYDRMPLKALEQNALRSGYP
eukprot:3465344-Amphidinium_carterae.1